MTTDRLRALAFLFLVSGAGALVAETVWLRWLRGLLGATAPAASATLLAFFAGNALGAVLAGRRAPGWRRPVRAYAAVEGLAAAAALAVPLLLRLGEALLDGAYDALRAEPALLAALRFGVVLLATLPAATFYGASFPALGAAALGTSERIGRHGAGLYAVNLLGAAVGAALGAFWLPEALGVRGTYGVALALTAAAALGAFALSRSEPKRTVEAEHAVETKRTVEAEHAVEPERTVETEAVESAEPELRRGPLAIAAVSGFGTLSAQVLAVQALAQVLNQSVYAFGTVLVVVLGALALAAAAVARLGRRPGSTVARLGEATVVTAL